MASTSDIGYFTFSAANEAAIHLLENVRREPSPPALISNEDSIGYRLSIPSENPHSTPTCHDQSCFNWRIGTGPSPNKVKAGVESFTPEILLCPQAASPTPSSKTVRAAINHIHATLYIHPRSRVLVMESRTGRPIIYERGDMNNQDVVIYGDASKRDRSCVLRRRQNFIRFGPYRFLLEFTVSPQQQDEFSKRVHRHHRHNPGDPCSLVPTTDAEPEILWNVWLHQNIPESVSVWSGVDIQDGQPVAVKELLNKAETRQYTIDQLDLASDYKGSPAKGILGVLEIWCEHWKSPPCLFRTSSGIDHCRHTYFSMPLAEQNFLHDRWIQFTTMESLAYLYHTLCGLAELHNQGFIHGNIRPELLLICEKRAFISLCMNKAERPDADVCVAPEFWLSRDQESDLDATKLDIWALAASWIYRCLNAPADLKVTQRSHARLQEALTRRNETGHIKGSLYRLLQRMLAWEPKDRPSASEALEDEAWRPVLGPRVVARKRKRTQSDDEEEGYSKQVRLAIPRVR
ncbi:kinase-like domain-containing protein [Trichoderma sp. SZMC 28014]